MTTSGVKRRIAGVPKLMSADKVSSCVTLAVGRGSPSECFMAINLAGAAASLVDFLLFAALASAAASPSMADLFFFSMAPRSLAMACLARLAAAFAIVSKSWYADLNGLLAEAIAASSSLVLACLIFASSASLSSEKTCSDLYERQGGCVPS